jgi:hypothetical protein
MTVAVLEIGAAVVAGGLTIGALMVWAVLRMTRP